MVGHKLRLIDTANLTAPGRPAPIVLDPQNLFQNTRHGVPRNKSSRLHRPGTESSQTTSPTFAWPFLLGSNNCRILCQSCQKDRYERNLGSRRRTFSEVYRKSGRNAVLQDARNEITRKGDHQQRYRGKKQCSQKMWSASLNPRRYDVFWTGRVSEWRTGGREEREA
jgi:hypothetical protein